MDEVLDDKTKKVIVKLLIVIIVLVVLLFGSINFIWYQFKYLPYKNIADKMQFNNNSEMPRYTFTDDEYLYRLKMPSYLSFESGFLYIGPIDEDAASFVADGEGNLTEKNIPHVDMFVWLRVFSETQYGITIYKEDCSFQYMINKDVDLIPDESMSMEEKEIALSLIYEHKSEIQDMLQSARKLFGNNI